MNTKQEAKPKVSDFNPNATKNDLYLDHSDNSSPEALGSATRSLDPVLLNNPQNNCFDSDLHKSHGNVAERQDIKSSQTPQLYALITNIEAIVRPLQKLAVGSEDRNDSEQGPGVYESVHDDSSTESTQKFASTVEFRKKSPNNINQEQARVSNTFFSNKQSCKEQNASNNLYEDDNFDKVKPQI